MICLSQNRFSVMKNIFTLSELIAKGAFISQIDGNHVDDNYEVEKEDVLNRWDGMPDTFIQYNFVNSNFEPVYLKWDAEIKKISDSHSLLGDYYIGDIYGRDHRIILALTNPFNVETLIEKDGKHYKFFINYSDGDASYNAASVIYLDDPSDNLNLQILTKVSADLDLKMDEEQRYSTTPNYFGVKIENIEEIDFEQFKMFQTMFQNHVY